MRNFVHYQLPLLAYAALIFIVSAIPTLPHPDIGIGGIDKIAHLFEYMIFFMLAVRAFGNKPYSFDNHKLIIFAGVISGIYAVLDEFHQAYVPGRNADIFDILADTAGILCGIIIYKIWIKHKTNVEFKRPSI